MSINSLAWQLYTPNQKDYSVIFGTIHLGSEDSLYYFDEICQLIDLYPRVFTESGLDASDAAYTQQFTTLAPSTSPYDYVTHNRWNRMRSTFIKYCKMDIDHLKSLHPLFILTHLQISLLNDQSSSSLDQQIWNYAKRQEKEVKGIETAQEQVSILQSLDLEQLYTQLIKMSSNITKARSSLRLIQDLYRRQEIVSLYKRSKQALGKDKYLLINCRNKILAERLLISHEDCPSFFSFGAGHLAGIGGVLHLLKQKGGLIRPINLNKSYEE